MLDPFGELASDWHRAATLRALPMALLAWVARQISIGHTVLGENDELVVYTPEEMNGLCELNQAERQEK